MAGCGAENGSGQTRDGSPRILMYTQDSLGLGHLRRATNLANALVARRADLSVLLVVDSPVAPFFELNPHIDFVKLPTVVKVEAGVFRPGNLLTGYDAIKEMRANLIREIMLRFRPHVCLVDHMPGGANRELLPALEVIREAELPVHMVLGLRDIIDAPEVTRAVWQREGVYEAMEAYYDDVLIYGAADVYATAREYRLPASMDSRVHYCGYVCNMESVRPEERMREKLGVADEPIVAVMAGGGADAFRLMRTYLEAAELLQQRQRFSTVMVTGPFMPEEQRRLLREMAGDRGAQVKTSIGDSMSQIASSDVVVSMAGYNTLSEILRFGTRAVIVPRPGPSAEQSMRARLFERRGLVDVLEQRDMNPTSLAAAVEQALIRPTSEDARRPPQLDGVATATGMLLRWLAEAEAGPPSPARVDDEHESAHDGRAASRLDERPVAHTPRGEFGAGS